MLPVHLFTRSLAASVSVYLFPIRCPDAWNRGMTQQLPLFPLNSVLFPGAQLPLHVFEERYRVMIGLCIEQHAPFGVPLIIEGRAEEADVTFCTIGTIALISEYERLNDGRYYLVATGQRRFRIQQLVQRRPYYIAAVTPLADEAAAPAATLDERLRVLYARYGAAISATTGVELAHEAIPEETVDLSYWMADRFQVDVRQKQRWLEADLMTRLHLLISVLQAELALLPNQQPGAQQHGLSGGNSLN